MTTKFCFAGLYYYIDDILISNRTKYNEKNKDCEEFPE